MQPSLDRRSIEHDIALAIAKGEVALWFGPDWCWQDTPDERQLAQHDWVGFWSESRDPATASFLSSTWEDRPFRRTFVEVPGQLSEALDRDYSFARRCPYFYLAGRDPVASELSPKRQLILRASHADQIERLGPATLVLAGIHKPEHLVAVLQDDLEQCVDRLRRIVVTGISHAQAFHDALRPLGGSVTNKVALVEDTLPTLLARIASSRETAALEIGDQLLVGRQRKQLPLRGLLHTAPPVDQYFHIITASDLRDAEADERSRKGRELLMELLGGQDPPWRAFRHELEWQRPIGERLKEQVLELLRNMSSPAPPTVQCLNLVADPGSGLTTILQLLAFHAADKGYPTLVARDSSQRFQFDILRAFLFDLDHQTAEIAEPGVPVVIVLDVGVTQRDPTNAFKDLPRRLRAINRRVLLIRGAHSKEDLPTPASMVADIHVPSLCSTLQRDEYAQLKAWVHRTYAQFYPHEIDAKVKTVDEWTAETEDTKLVPLLVGLYFLLQEDLRQAADLGQHLLKDLARLLETFARERKDVEPAGGLPIPVKEGGYKRLNLGRPKPAANHFPKQLVEGLTIAAALARLDEFVPISVLAKVVGADTTETYRALSQLEKARLVKTDELAKYSPSGRRLMPVTYYEDWETVSLVHPMCGEMILDSLCADESNFGQLLNGSGLCQQILDVHRQVASDHDLRLQFLQPVFRVLEPGIPAHRWFAEYISMQHLRPQRHTDIDENVHVSATLLELLLGAFDWLNPVLIETSGPLLHSRALARTQMGFRQDEDHLERSRECFETAIQDIDLAIELETERFGGEDVGNLKTTCGHIHLKWAIRELKCRDGSRANWELHTQRAKEYFEVAYNLKQNSYPAHALANLILHDLEFKTGRRQPPPGKESWIAAPIQTEFAGDLSKAMELLSVEPELDFLDRWNDTRQRAIQLLDDEPAAEMIDALKRSGDEMGYALDALRILGSIPRSPIDKEDREEVLRLGRADLVLAEAEDQDVPPCALGNLLRYAIFSARPERALSNKPFDPAYRQRHKLMRRVLETGAFYLRDPIWRYDAAMLCFQNRDIAEGRRHFVELRKASRFMNVPQERTVPWVKHVDNPVALVAELRITRVDRTEDRGWGRIVKEDFGYAEEIPFRISSFTTRGNYRTDDFQPGKRIDAGIQLRPAGPHAIPIEERKRSP